MVLSGHVADSAREMERSRDNERPVFHLPRSLTTRVVIIGEMTEPEQTQFIDWAWTARDRTTFDSNVIGHPRTTMFICEDRGIPIAYLPTQTVLMAEAFIPRPGMEKRMIAAALGRFDEALYRAARTTGIGDIYCYVPTTESDYAGKVMRHGWVEVPEVRLFRQCCLRTN
jgi:hypothetical protein